MTYQVELTARAERDVDGILAWLTQKSSRGAAAWHKRLQDVFDHLATTADQFGLAPENEDHDEGIRHVIFKTRRGRKYRALFIIRDDQVYILHVRGPGQDILAPRDIQFP